MNIFLGRSVFVISYRTVLEFSSITLYALAFRKIAPAAVYARGSPAPSDCSHSHLPISPPSAFLITADRITHSGRRAQSDKWRSPPLWIIRSVKPTRPTPALKTETSKIASPGTGRTFPTKVRRLPTMLATAKTAGVELQPRTRRWLRAILVQDGRHSIGRTHSAPKTRTPAGNAATDLSLPSLQKKRASRSQELCPFAMRGHPPEGSHSARRACRHMSRATTLSRAVHNRTASSMPGLKRGASKDAATPVRERFPTAWNSQLTALTATQVVAVMLHSWACRRPGAVSVQGARDRCGHEQATRRTRTLCRIEVTSAGWLVLPPEWSAGTVRPPNLSCRGRTDQHFRIRGLLTRLQAQPLRDTVPDAANLALSCTRERA